MSADLLIILSVIIVGFIALAIFLNKKLSSQKPEKNMLEVMRILQQSSSEDRKVLLDTLSRNTASLNERLDNAARVIASVSKNVGEMNEIGRSMKDLQEFLRSPKLRGNIGEQVLKELLEQMLPKQSFHLQYNFRNGTIVDAAVKTSAGIIPIDAKFPMENFRKMMGAQNETEKKLYQNDFVKDVKKHIEAISKKYILTHEGTIDYALMYIPSEAVYYEIVNSDSDLVGFSHEQRVLPVSPTTFYAFLRAILMSFEGAKIDQKAKEMVNIIRSIQKDYERVDDTLSTLQKHITNSYNMMTQVNLGFTQLGQKITATKSLGEDKTPLIEQTVMLQEDLTKDLQ